MDSLSKSPSIDTLLLAAEGGLPKSKAVAEFNQKLGSESLLALSDKIAKEQGAEDFYSENRENYLKEIDSSEFIFNLIASSNLTYSTKLLVEYVSQGGNVNLGGQILNPL